MSNYCQKGGHKDEHLPHYHIMIQFGKDGRTRELIELFQEKSTVSVILYF